MRAIIGISIALMLLIPFSEIPSANQGGSIIVPLIIPSGNEDIIRNWTVQIVLVNYDSEVIDTTSLISGYPTQKDYSTDVSITYNIEYEVNFASESYVNNLKQLLLDNSINGSDTGTWLNETALAYQEINPDEPQRIFYPSAGRAIDAYIVEDWLAANPAFEAPALGYTLYLLNFSEFDSEDHSLEHWYDYHPEDPDTGEEQDWFRLEWDNALNPNVKFEYVGFGGRTGNLYVLDASADQWYMRWARIWWGDEPYADHPDYCTMDLEDKMAEVDLGTQPGVDAFNSYLNEYVWDPINLLFFPYQHAPTSYVETGLLKGLVFGMDVQDGISVESLEWVTNAEMQKAHLEELLPFIEWTVDVEFLDITNYPDWEDLFWSNATLDAENNTVAVGSKMFWDIYYRMKPVYVNINDPNINVFGVVFIKKNMTMIYDGRTFTGLGGGGQTVIWKSWERYYRPDGTTPKNGISDVQLHETMHAIGLGHTWQYAHYGGDFVYSPMGYFASHNGTGLFDQTWVQSTYLDQMESDYWTRFYDYIAEYPDSWTGPGEEAYNNAITYFQLAQNRYNEMEWIECCGALRDALTWVESFYESNFDSIAPMISGFGAETDSYDGINLTIWAQITDDSSGVYNASVYVNKPGSATMKHKCNFNGSHWIGQVPELVSGTTITIWMEAYDYAENVAQTPTTQVIVPERPIITSSTSSSETTTPSTHGGSSTVSTSNMTTSTPTSTSPWTFPIGMEMVILITFIPIFLIIIVLIIRRRK